jgi:hypothetical protein
MFSPPLYIKMRISLDSGSELAKTPLRVFNVLPAAYELLVRSYLENRWVFPYHLPERRVNDATSIISGFRTSME